MPRAEWERVAPWLQAALGHAGNTHTLDDVARLIGENKALLLAGERSAIVCEIVVYPRLRELRVWLGGGDLEELKSSSAQLDDIARAHGCSRISITGRRGWVRALAGIGAREKYVAVEREVQ